MKAYELRIYQVAPGKMEVLQGIFHELVIPMLPDYAIGSIGYWSTLDGLTLYYLVSHDSLNVMEDNWEHFHADLRWKPGLAAREQGQTVVTGTESVPLVGIAGLPPLNVAAIL
jgi:hypothetical protein